MSLERQVSSLGWASIACGAMGFLGWASGSPYLLSIHPAWVTMKPPTALYCVLAGVSLLGLRQREKADRSFGAGASFILLGTSGIILGLALIIPNEHALLPFSGGYEALTVSSGEPSLGTLAAFISAGASGLLLYLGVTAEAGAGYAITAILGAVAVLGYALQSEALIWYLPGISTAMALHTSLACLAVGIGGNMLARSRSK